MKTIKRKRSKKNKNKNKTYKHKQTKQNKQGGNSELIRYTTQLVLNDDYIIEFYDQGRRGVKDFVFYEFAPKYNGRYTYKGKRTLRKKGEYASKEYYIFKSKSNYTELHLLVDEVDECGGFECYFRTLLDEYHEPLIFFSNHTAETHSDNYNFIFCTIKPFTDIMNVSRVSRKNPIKYLPLDVERNIQSYLVNDENVLH